MEPIVRVTALDKYFGRLQVLKNINLEVAAAGGHLHHRAQRLWQEHFSALPQFPGGTVGRHDRGGRACPLARAERARSSVSACTTFA